MLGVYIVDDERLVVDELLNSMPWLENGFEVIGFNVNSEIAVAEIIQMKPAVVFSDLRMPVCDGIELIRRVLDSGIETEFIMLSAYGDFEATRSFFLMGGLDYILKPLDQGNASLVLEKISRKLAYKSDRMPASDFLSSPSKNFNDLIEYITTNYNMKLSLNDLSLMFSMSPTYICDLFSKYYASTFKIFITNLRMKEASRLMLETDASLKEIAMHCGYSDYYYFCKVFKAQFEKTPTEFRTMRSKENPC